MSFLKAFLVVFELKKKKGWNSTVVSFLLEVELLGYGV